MVTESKPGQTRMYALGRDKVLVKTSSPLIEGWETCDSLPTLMSVVGHDCRDDIKPGVKWRGEKIPAELMVKMLGTISQFKHMETGFVLGYNPVDRKWDIVCTRQDGHGAAVKFKAEKELKAGYAEIGTVHTHPEMSARWSQTDQHDQRGKYGVHCVLGLRDGKVSQYKWTVYTPLGEYDVEWDEIAETVDFAADYEPVKEWVELIKQGMPEPAVRERKDRVALAGAADWATPFGWRKGLLAKPRHIGAKADYGWSRETREELLQAAIERCKRTNEDRELLLAEILDSVIRTCEDHGMSPADVINRSLVGVMFDDLRNNPDPDSADDGYIRVDPDDDQTMEELHDTMSGSFGMGSSPRWTLVDAESKTVGDDLRDALDNVASLLKRTPVEAVRDRIRRAIKAPLQELGFVPEENAHA